MTSECDASSPRPTRSLQQHPSPEPSKLSPARQRLRRAIVAFSLSNLCLITAWFATYFDKDFGYFNKLSVSSNTMVALLANLLLLTTIFWVARECILKMQRRWLTAAADLAFIAMLLIPFDFARMNLLQINDYHLLEFARNPFGMAGIVVVGVALIRWHRQAVHCVASVLVVLSPLALLTATKALLVLFGIVSIAQDAGNPRQLAPLLATTNGPRVIWILFDELDYRVAFVDRPSKVRLPELDRLSRESFTATHAYPPGASTIVSVPALTTGQPVERAVVEGADDLSLQLAGNSKRMGWTEIPTIFSESRSLGINVGIVGWYHPYERLFNFAASYCAWYPLGGVEPARALKVFPSMERQLCSMAGPFNLRYLHLRNYQQLLRASRTLATNQSFGLSFLHLPVPHKPGIYLPETDKLTFRGVAGKGGYLGNLTLADRTLGTLRQDMEAAGLWSKSWVIVSSDHWWREGTGNKGTIDHRVPFIVKAPQGGGSTYEVPFSTRISHDLILAIFRGELSHANQLSSWLDDHHVDRPATYSSGGTLD